MFGPRGVEIGQIQRVQKVPIGAVARVTDQVHLGEAGLRDVPVISLDRARDTKLDRDVAIKVLPGIVKLRREF